MPGRSRGGNAAGNFHPRPGPASRLPRTGRGHRGGPDDRARPPAGRWEGAIHLLYEVPTQRPASRLPQQPDRKRGVAMKECGCALSIRMSNGELRNTRRHSSFAHRRCRRSSQAVLGDRQPNPSPSAAGAWRRSHRWSRSPYSPAARRCRPSLRRTAHPSNRPRRYGRRPPRQ